MTVLILGARFNAGVAAAHSLARAGYRVVGADLEPLTRWTRSRYLDAHHALPPGDDDAVGRSLVDVLRRQPCDVVLPIGTPFVRAMLRERAAIGQLTAANLPSDEAFAAAYHKRACMTACADAGVPCAGALSDAEARARLACGDGRSLVVKPAWDVGGADGVTYVTDPVALAPAMAACRARYGEALVQEHIPGGVTQMTALTVLFDTRGRFVAGFALQKTRQWPPTGGVTVSARAIAMEPLLAQVRPWFASVGWTGPAEVEFKRDPRDGVDKVIEINPRVPGYLRFLCAAGVDLPRLIADTALGRDPGPPPAATPGAAFVAPGHLTDSLRTQAATDGWWRTWGTGIVDVIRAAPSLVPLLLDPLPVVARWRDTRREGVSGGPGAGGGNAPPDPGR